MEHEISAIYDVAHGAGLAVVFPAWLTFMLTHNPAKVDQYAQRVWGVPTGAEGIAALRKFLKSIGMPTTMSELGIAAPDIDALVRNLHENKGATIGAYYRLTAADTKKIYELML